MPEIASPNSNTTRDGTQFRRNPYELPAIIFGISGCARFVREQKY